MAFIQLLFVGAALSLTFFSGSEAGQVGVCWGMKGSNLMQPPDVVRLLKYNCIKMVRLYDADAGALRALANTGIKVGVSLPNGNLVDAGSMSYARQWVKSNVQAYPNTLINSVAVGNEVFRQAPELTPRLLPAMKNIQAALASAGLADAVKVITPIAFDALNVSYPPSRGKFQDNLAQSVMSPMVDFLCRTGSHLTFNIYPYFAYKNDTEHINLNYILFRPNSGQYDWGTGLTYYNMFDAMADAVFHAVEKLISSRKHSTRGRMLQGVDDAFLGLMQFSETGLPGHPAHKGTHLHRGGNIGASQKSVEAAATTENAQTYNSNLISKVLRGTGTPYKPNANFSGYIFALFNENQKPGDDDERNFGLFYPDGTPVYKVDFDHPVPSPAPPAPAKPSWCTANAAVGNEKLQDALNYACGNGADCSAIQTGGRCFDPNTMVAHAPYAFNDYYQRNGRSDRSCDFGGSGSVVHQQPKFGNCVFLPRA